MKILQQHYLINEFNYFVNDFEKDFKPKSESISQNNKTKIAIRRDLKEAFLETDIDLDTTIETESGEELPFRTLKISVRYVYEVIDGTSEEEIKSLIKSPKVINVVKQQSKDLIRTLTNLDYQPPIIIQSIEIE